MSSTESTNFARLSRLVVDVICDLLRAVLKAKMPSPGLTAILQSQRVQLYNNLENRQRHVLYPVGGVFVGTLEDLDFTLLYRLVRNIQGISIPPHKNGWGKTPATADRSLSANIDRLRVQRNEAYGHLPTASLSDSEFNSRWSLIRQSVLEIEKCVLTGDTYVTAVDGLLTVNMDPEAEKYYIEELEKQQKADLEVKAILQDVKDDVAAIKDTVNVISANTSHVKEIHPDLKPMIETAKARIKKEKEEKKFYPTKGFCDAKVKLQKNRVVVIRGNTGDGKTAIAVQLLHWLSQEQGAGQPLQLHKIKKLDLLAPSLKLITFIDDIFGEKDVCKKNVQEWNERISDVKTLFLDEQKETNFLLITVRNEVFNSLEKRSLGTIFTKDNLIDLSSDTYKVAEEKKRLLELYKPENFSWLEEEKNKILTYAPNIGFPQCCQLFYNSEKLQKERVKFFENPFHLLNEALSRLQECSALLYLFLHDGMIRVKDLDPNSKTVDKKLLEEAFEINLIDGENDSTKLTKKKKVGFVKESLDKLLGFLVVKEKHWPGEDVYRFNHDSIYVAVAFLYGKVTPIGYIQNCPSKSLSYLTTSKTATNMIVISSDQYTEMCERLLREFECKENRYGTSIGSLDVWNDPVFVKRFVWLLNDRKVDKLVVLNKACSFGAEECALYLLSEGVKPDKSTALPLVTSRHWNDSNRQVCLLKKIVVPLNDATKLAVLNSACSFDAEECALYLLCEGVEPDKETVIRVIEGGSVKVLRKLLQYDVTHTAMYKSRKNVLHMACMYMREEMMTLLCDTYPHLVHGTDWSRQTPLYIVAERGNCSMFQTVERCVLNSLYRVEDQQHKCETVDGGVVHRNCVCAQYMAQLVDDEGDTVLHVNCFKGNREVCLYLCQSYPALTTSLSEDGRHCLHYMASSYMSDVDMFTEFETHIKQYLESTGRKYDITIILDNNGETVLHKSCKGGNRKVCLYLCQSYPALTTAVSKDGCHCLHDLAGKYRPDVDWFIECETHVKQYLESTGRKYDITTILDNNGESVLDKAKEGAKELARIGGRDNRLLDHLIKVFGKQKLY